MSDFFISKNIDSWALENYSDIFNELVKLTNSLEYINNKSFKRKTLLKIKQIKTNLFDSYNLLEKKILDKNLLYKEIDKTSNAETPDKMSKTSICFGFTPLLYRPIGFEELPLVMSARHTYLCTNPFGFYNDRYAHYHNLDAQVLKDLPFNLDNVIFIYHSQTHKESICCVLDYDIDIKNEFGDKTGNKTKLQLFIKPKSSNINTFHYSLPIESNLIATMYEYTPECVSNLIYVNKNKKSLAQQLISHDIQSKDRVEVVFNSGFYINNIKHYQSSVNKILQLKHPLIIDEKLILYVNEEINKNDKPDINSIVQSYFDFTLKEPILSNKIITENSSEIYQEEDVTKIINKSLEMKDGKLTEKGWSDISKTLQAYSDKRFETARYLFVQNRKIIRHVAISVQNPNATISKPDENVTYLEKLKTFAQNTNSSVVFVHNHPSGYVEPSSADKDTTEYLHNFFGDLFAGHIILDHGKFGIYEPTNQKWQALIDNKIYEMEEGKKQFSIHGSQMGVKQIINEKDLSILADYAKKIDSQAKWNRDDWIPSFYSTHQGIVQSLEYLHNDDLKVENYQGLTNQIKNVGRDVGCNYIYLVPKTLEQKMLCEAFAQKTRIVQDIYFEKEDGTFELSNYSGGDIFSSITKEEIKMDDSINYEIINEEDKDIMEKKEQNPWFEKLSDIEKEAVLSDMRINPDLIGEYHSELAEANIDYKEYDRPSDKWVLNKINYKNLDGEFSYFNENNIGQQRHYAEVINEYKKELAAKQEINDEVIMNNSIVPNDSNFEPVTTENVKDGYLFNPKTVKRESLSEPDEKRLLEDFDVIGKFENAVGQWSEYSNIYNFFDFHNHSDEFLKFMDAAREEKEISGHRDNISFVQHYLENKLGIPIYKDGERISSNWTTEEREKYSTVISKLNFIAQAIVKSHEPYIELPSGRENVIDNSEKLELLGAKNVTELEKTLKKIKDELNPQYQKNLEKNINEIHNKQEINDEAMDVNGDITEDSLKSDYEEDLKQDTSIKASEIIKENVQNTSESVVTNFLLEKLNKAGIETIFDKEIYENMLAYVKEVNICLEMLEAEQYPVQMMDKKEKGSSLGTHLGNQQASGRTLYHKYNISEQERQEMLTDFETKLDISLFSNDATDFIQQIKELFNLGVEKSDYAHINIDGQKYTIRISDHGVNTNTVKKNEIESSIVIQLPETKNNRFRNQNAKAVKQFTYKGNTLTEERKRDILEGLHNYLKTGEFNGKLADDVRSTTAYELQQNLAEQMTLGGIKKGLMTGVALATMFCNMPKLAAETKITNRDTLEETGVVQMETTLELVNYKDGSIAICNAGNKNKFLDIVIITNSDGTPVACYDYNVWKNNVIVNGELENAKRAKTKPIVVSMDAKKFIKFLNNWENIGLTYYTSGGTISEFVKQNYVDLINGWIKGENLKQAEFMIQDSLTYGFTLNNKIYLNPEIMNSNAIAHEYTHLWDKYIQKENPALWEHGKEIFKQTSLWNEVINDGNYKAISNNEDLILSECHSRICGKFAEEVLNKIAKENGNEIKEEVIDWDKEVELFIAKEFGIKNPNYEMSNSINIKEQLAQENYNKFKNFLSQPMKDLIAGKEILKEHIIDNVELEKKLTNSTELNESINNDIPVMPNVSDLQHSESNEVQILKKELDDVKAALKQVKKENNTLRQENELLKGKNNNINATQNVKETGEESIYREETKDTGTEINFNRNTAFNINCPIPPFGHEKEDGSIEIIENAHFAKHLLNKYDSASNKVVLTYADESGKHHEIEMHEREYRKMINVCEEFAEKIKGVAENSYEWYLLHERKAKIMKTDQNILRLNFACNFIHNYRIMCKLYASNEGEAVKQAQKLVDMMHPNERKVFNKWRKQVGEKSFDDLLLKEFRDHVQGIENKESLILNNNELLYDVNKRYLEFQKDEEIVLTKYDKVIKNSGKKIGDTIKMAFKYESFGGKKLKTPMLEYQIVKVTKNQSPDTVLLYNAEQKITQTIPLKDFMNHVRKIEKQQLKENAEQIKKDFKKYGYEGQSL